jgi:hypothetical protein
MKSIALIAAMFLVTAGCITNSDSDEPAAGLFDDTGTHDAGNGCGTLSQASQASQLTFLKYVDATKLAVTYRAACVFNDYAAPATPVTFARIDFGAASTVCTLVQNDDVKLFFAARGATEFFPAAVSKDCAALPVTAAATAVKDGPLYCRPAGMDAPITKSTEFKALAAGKLGHVMDACTRPVETYLLK